VIQRLEPPIGEIDMAGYPPSSARSMQILKCGMDSLANIYRRRDEITLDSRMKGSEAHIATGVPPKPPRCGVVSIYRSATFDFPSL